MAWELVVVLEVVAAIWFGALINGLVHGWREVRALREQLRIEEEEAARVGGFGGGVRPLSDGEIEPPPVGPPQEDPRVASLWASTRPVDG